MATALVPGVRVVDVDAGAPVMWWFAVAGGDAACAAVALTGRAASGPDTTGAEVDDVVVVGRLRTAGAVRETVMGPRRSEAQMPDEVAGCETSGAQPRACLPVQLASGGDEDEVGDRAGLRQRANGVHRGATKRNSRHGEILADVRSAMGRVSSIVA
jgi:hypothetical protein